MHDMFVIPSVGKKNILYISKTVADQSFEPISHAHGNLEIQLVTNGHGSIQLGNQTLEVKEKDLLIINSKERHCEYSKNGLEFYSIGIASTTALFDTEIGNSILISLKSSYSSFLFLFDRIFEESKLKKNQYLELIASYYKCLELLIRRKNVQLTDSNLKNQINDDDTVNKIKAIIDANYYSDIKLKDLAHKMTMSISSICHIFKKQTNMSIFQYKLNKQLDEAGNLLKTSDMNVSEIASLVGFSDSSCFIKYFKSKYNMTPNVYKQQKNH